MFLIKICDEKLVIILIRVKKNFKFFAMLFSTNIKFLRKRRSKTQDDVATALNMKRSTLSGYENEVSEPNIEALLALSKYFNVAIDTLIKVDLTKIGEFQLSQLERGYDVHLKGSNIRVLATTVDSGNRENIELVSEHNWNGVRRRTLFASPTESPPSRRKIRRVELQAQQST